ncbi:MAG: nucleotidyltransferase family protein [Candidatus Aureabacteria bacterium]|nr:nucleotidyltransferase family protein [Candidatus Auribacterota bacterium]MCK5161120.1 nucleotidyltransferase family protein [Candidatus Auribacterota bacterium]
MKALILAAGYATRLYPLTLNTAKPLLMVGKRRMIDYIVDSLCKLKGLKEIYVVTNEKFSSDFKTWASSGKNRVPITVINDHTKEDETKLGAVGDIHFVVKEKQVDDDLVVVAGDNLFDVDMGKFTYFAEKRGPAVCLYDVGDKELSKKYAVVTIDENKRIIKFVEKPPNPETTLISMCLYYYPREVFPMVDEYLSEGGNPDAPGHFVQWLYKKANVYGYLFDGLWFDIGDKKSLQEADAAIKQNLG